MANTNTTINNINFLPPLSDKDKADLRVESIAEASEFFESATNLKTVSSVISSSIKQVSRFKSTLETPDSLFAIGFGIAQIAQAQKAKRHQTQKTLFGATNAVFGAQQLLISEGLSAVVLSGVVTGAAAMGMSVTAGLSCAAGMWAATAMSCHAALKANKKMNMEYLAHDRLIKYTNVGKQITKLEAQLETAKKNDDKKNSKSLRHKINELNTTQNVLLNQAEAIVKVEYANKPLKGDPLIHGKNIKQYLQENCHIDVTTPATMQQKTLVKHLKEKQEDKRDEALLTTAEVAMGATGLTLLAFTPLCPPLAIPGLVLTGASACAGFYNLAKHFVTDKISQKIAINTEQKNIITNLKSEIKSLHNKSLDQYFTDIGIPNKRKSENGNIKVLSEQERVKFYYLYKNSGINKTEDFVKALSTTPRGKVHKILNENFNEIAKNNLLQKHFKLDTNAELNQMFSKKDQSNTFAEYARENHGLLKTVARFFKPAEPETKKDANVTFTPKP